MLASFEAPEKNNLRNKFPIFTFSLFFFFFLNLLILVSTCFFFHCPSCGTLRICTYRYTRTWREWCRFVHWQCNSNDIVLSSVKFDFSFYYLFLFCLLLMVTAAITRPKDWLYEHRQFSMPHPYVCVCMCGCVSKPSYLFHSFFFFVASLIRTSVSFAGFRIFFFSLFFGWFFFIVITNTLFTFYYVWSQSIFLTARARSFLSYFVFDFSNIEYLCLLCHAQCALTRIRFCNILGC